MNHPRDGERVLVQPNGRKVQRGERMYGQFIADQGEELRWDQYLHQRLTEGAITWKPLLDAVFSVRIHGQATVEAVSREYTPPARPGIGVVEVRLVDQTAKEVAHAADPS